MSMAPPRHGLAVRVLLGPFAPLTSHPCRRLALRVVVEPGEICLAWRVVVWLLVVSFGPLCLRVRYRDVVRSFVLLCGRPCRRSAIPGCCSCRDLGLRGQWGQGTKEGLVTHWLGLPLPGSPLWLLLPLSIFLHFPGPHPSTEGRGTSGLDLHGREPGGAAAR